MKRLVAGRFAASLIGSALQAVMLLLLATKLGVSDFGIFGAISALALAGSTLLGLGFPARALRLAAEPQPLRMATTMMLFRICVVGVLFIALWIVATVSPELRFVAMVSGSIAGTEIVTELAQNTLTGVRRVRAASILLVTQRTLTLVAVAISNGTDQLAGCLAIASAIVILANVAVVARRRPQMRGVFTSVRETSGYWRANIAASVSSLEQPLVTAIGGSSVGGLYAVGARLLAPVNLLSQSMIAVTAADLATAPSEDRDRLFARIRKFAIIIAGIGACMALPAGLVLMLLLGIGYELVWIPVAACVVAGTLMGVNQCHQSMLFALGVPSVAARCVFVGTIAGLAAAALGAAAFGIVGASAAPVLAQATMLTQFVPSVARARRQ